MGFYIWIYRRRSSQILKSAVWMLIWNLRKTPSNRNSRELRFGNRPNGRFTRPLWGLGDPKIGDFGVPGTDFKIRDAPLVLFLQTCPLLGTRQTWQGPKTGRRPEFSNLGKGPRYLSRKKPWGWLGARADFENWSEWPKMTKIGFLTIFRPILDPLLTR